MEIKPIEPIVKTQISNQKWKSVKVENNPHTHKSFGKTFEDYLNECIKSDENIIDTDKSKKLEESIPYISMGTENKDDVDYYVNIAKVKMAYGY